MTFFDHGKLSGWVNKDELTFAIGYDRIAVSVHLKNNEWFYFCSRKDYYNRITTIVFLKVCICIEYVHAKFE